MLANKNRFKGNRQIMTIIKKGQTVYGQNLKIKYLNNKNQAHSKFAVVVSKKISKSAVVRNRIRRRIYANLGHYLTYKGLYVVFVYSDNFYYIKNGELTTILNEMFSKTR